MTGVLVVDELQGRRTAVRNALAERGYDVRTASDRHDGLDRVRRSSPAVVVVGVDGTDAAGRVRRVISAGRTPVVAVVDGSAAEVDSLADCGGVAVVGDDGSTGADLGDRVAEAVAAVEGTPTSELATTMATVAAQSVERTVDGDGETEAWTDPDLPPRAEADATLRTDGAATADRSGWPAGDRSTVDVDVPAFDPPAGEFTPTVVVGASAGGPNVVETVLAGLPRSLDARVLVVQHMPESFTGRLAEHLDAVSEYDVSEATDGGLVGAGEAVVAKGDRHLAVARRSGGRLRVRLTDGKPVHGVKPAVDVTMESAAGTATDPLVAVVLTGMGRDGAAGVEAVSEAGGLAFAQDRDSSPVFGMPEQAIATGAVDRVTPPEELPRSICEELRDWGTDEETTPENGERPMSDEPREGNKER
ncbi:chemotaxis response regulator protein-glutamate methylesterase [Halobacteriales archaeon QS_8_69_26]|nr:MAG: chemotaxis response regulator protein-glutamate methylesterase [Halobacteriales archaeon QS_8_69_26]